MSVEYKTVTHKIMELECYRRYTVHTLLKDSGIYFGQPPVLEYLEENGTCTQNELARAMNVSSASMAVSIKRMQKSGLVEKSSDQSDLRCNKISITDKGRKQVAAIHNRFDKMDEKIYEGFSNEELEVLNGFLARMNKNLSVGLPDKSKMFNILNKDYNSKDEGDSE